MWSDDRISALAAHAVKRAPGDAAQVSIYAADRNISRFAESSLRQNMSEVAGSATIRVWVGRRSGVATTSSLDEQSLQKAAELAAELAARSEENESFRGLPALESSPTVVDSYDEEIARLEVGVKASAIGRVFDEHRARGVRFAGTWTTIDGRLAVAASNGLSRLSRFSTSDALLIALRGQRSGFASQAARRLAGFDFPALAAEAVEKATLLDDVEGELEPGPIDVILEPAALAELFEWLSMIAFSGRSNDEAQSFLTGRTGERVVGENITIADDATDPGFMPFPFDLEGMSKRRVTMIENGIARTPLVDSLYAVKLGFTPTASCSDLSSDDHGMPLHLSMNGGTSTRQQLFDQTSRAVWITRFHYVNGLLEPKNALMTGTTRDGTFLIEGGRAVRRLGNLRWTQSIVTALQNVAALTAERRAIGTWWNPLGATIAPTILVRDWNFQEKR